jgi:hypothetical protein
MEQGPKFHVLPPKAADPMYRLIRRMRGRYTHFYFYIRDDVLGPFVMCVGSFLPFQTTYYLNGHHFIAGELERQGIRFRAPAARVLTESGGVQPEFRLSAQFPDPPDLRAVL